MSADPDAPAPRARVTFLAGQPMLMSMIRAPSPATRRAVSAIGPASQPAICTEVPAASRPSSAFSRTPGRAASISRLAIISLTTRPAPNCATSVRNGRSVIPAIGASRTGEGSCLFASESMFA